MNILQDKDKKIALRPMTKDDTSKIIAWRNNPRVRNNFIYQELLTPETHLNWIKTMIETGKAIQFIIVNHNNKISHDIGSVYFRDINSVHKKAEYGIFIGEDKALDFGYGTLACKLACRYGFEVMNLHKIFLRVFSDNFSAIRSYEKSGFIREGLLRDDVYINGKFRDILIMSMINTDKIESQGGGGHII